MGYNTKDLSTILNVSTNTIRRYEEKGFLTSNRNENNGYRQFAPIDVEKLLYVNKYRKMGFSQEDILKIFDEDISKMIDRYESKMDEIDAQIEHLKSVRHLVKDDLNLMKNSLNYKSAIIEGSFAAMNYILYSKKGEINLGKEHKTALYDFMNSCPEYEYMYHFSKSDIENNDYSFSEGVIANELMTNKYNVKMNEYITHYEKVPSLLKFVKVPLDFSNSKLISQEELEYKLFGQFFEHMEKHNQKLTGDVIAMKLCLSREEDGDWQYILMHFPIG